MYVPRATVKRWRGNVRRRAQGKPNLGRKVPFLDLSQRFSFYTPSPEGPSLNSEPKTVAGLAIARDVAMVHKVGGAIAQVTVLPQRSTTMRLRRAPLLPKICYCGRYRAIGAIGGYAVRKVRASDVSAARL